MQDKIKELKKDRSLVCAIILGLLPLVYVLIKILGDRTPVSLLTCEWNDELFYFKQVESIIDYGYPRGYYGFNESHALSLSFAAWSPVLVWPWVVLGKIFGWTMKSVFIYNTIIYMVAMFLFGIMAKPSVKQTILIGVWFFTFFLNLRYIYSCMPEVICFAHLIVFWGCMLGYFRVRGMASGDAAGGKVKTGLGYLVTAIILGVLMTFMRPYLILFLVLPLMVMFFTAKGAGKKFIVAVVAVAVMGFTAFVYYLLNHYLSAEYLMPFFYTDFITTFFTDGFGAGVHNLLGTLYYKGKDFIQFMKDAFYIGRAAGIFFDIYVLMMIVQAVQCMMEYKSLRRKKQAADVDARVYDLKKRIREAADRSFVVNSSYTDEKTTDANRNVSAGNIFGGFWCRLYMLFADFAFLMAILLMYKLTEGSKHLLTFICAGVILMIMDSGWSRLRGAVCSLIMCACLVYFGLFHTAGNSYDFGIPMQTDESEARYEYWQQAFAEGIELDLTDVPSYKNAIIWEFADDVDGKSVVTDWQMLYALPSGTGISCCWEYTDDNFDDIQCRYISAPSGGDIENLCIAAGYRCIGRDDRLCVYARY
jgi:hypothetical protein